ncbi:hypothetical protein HL653_06035 [Sphingomonas sp. AP4-R1]|uniref:hypothetical protein n=1 Tax=Sphingomonas sp. AP4-R1 TaxID=2735134 RepID=UPI0014939D31|nr:hypothetical protein [Sphingomonas sp. AP4-R1]QJU57409.1 hypothetical protein HL653_06035 [Sphingomonas sp. AP4-R1]
MPVYHNPLLEELKSHHCRLLECLTEMAEVTSKPCPDMTILAMARLRISKASSERSRFITEKVYPHLKMTADQDLLEKINLLSREMLAKRETSSEHVVVWNSTSIVADWQGYQAASLRIRRMMHRRIEQEADSLYGPLASFPTGYG